ncbi:TadE/TadG family type IV pilus assembly protein [Luteithermobacter gelatinilyticus]|uniref:TadE/TadG family type IV pilus assembly protein n=1 Tax=Luteithermobacter gelatinilyticus TaxID=2582913 RepID=UPI001106A0CB|nr:TadE/TadG family type IV pilus assembly protein [Luteithermobacter gelatinilyticus]|tara:strand:+ start:4478 stop:5122 length:645 start_codon:yes stop_codon:yes gene_type:complete
MKGHKTVIRSWFRRPIRRSLWRHERGSALIEAAFVLPIVTVLTIGTFEIGAVMLSNTLIEGAIADAARMGMTGYTSSGMTREEYITQLLKDQTFGMIDLDNLTITNKVYDSFSDIAEPEPYTDVDQDGSYTNGVDSYTDLNCNNTWDADVGEDGVGGPGAVVVYTATYDASFITGFFAKTLADKDGKIRLVSSTAVKNEPYGTASSSCTPEIKV